MTVDSLPQLLDGAMADLSPIHAHLAICPRCREFLQSYTATTRIIRDATAVDVPGDVAARLWAKLPRR
jgi:hypothetical protein